MRAAIGSDAGNRSGSRSTVRRPAEPAHQRHVRLQRPLVGREPDPLAHSCAARAPARLAAAGSREQVAASTPRPPPILERRRSRARTVPRRIAAALCAQRRIARLLDRPQKAQCHVQIGPLPALARPPACSPARHRAAARADAGSGQSAKNSRLRGSRRATRPMMSRSAVATAARRTASRSPLKRSSTAIAAPPRCARANQTRPTGFSASRRPGPAIPGDRRPPDAAALACSAPHGHLLGRRSAHRAKLLEHARGDAERLLLGRVGIGDVAALEPLRAARARRSGTWPASRRCRIPPPPPAARLEQRPPGALGQRSQRPIAHFAHVRMVAPSRRPAQSL